MINVEIDGKKIEVKEGTAIIEAAEQAGIWIPRFCYHKKLSVAANCRMCLVEVEKAPKPMASCATPVAEGMKIFTTSQKALDAQKVVMEFLLINHPLDCPVCDQGGQCELQDIAMGYGRGTSDYTFTKRSIADKDLGSLIATDMTRCIFCTRCVRFSKEIAGVRDLGMVGRGEHSEITTYIEQTLKHEMSANIIDLCPVGALTAKPSRFTARPWELTQHPSIAPHDCIGSHIYIHTRSQRVMRVVPRDYESLNETWISDRDRFSYEGIYSAHRLLEPQLRQAASWQSVTWEQALTHTIESLSIINERWGKGEIAALASPNCTLEEYYLLRRLMTGLGSPHIDHRLREVDVSDQASQPLFPSLGATLGELEQTQTILLIGSHLAREVPILHHRLRKASLRGAAVMVLNAYHYEFNCTLSEQIITAAWIQELAGILAAVILHNAAPTSDPFYPYLSGITPNTQQQRIAQRLLSGSAHILLGQQALHHPQASLLRRLVQELAQRTGARYGLITQGANGAGAWIAGAIPHRTTGGAVVSDQGLSYAELLCQSKRAYILMNIEPEFDAAQAPALLAKLREADFVVALTPFFHEQSALYDIADVVLPLAVPMESSGTFINALGDWQSFQGAVAPSGQARPGWKILRVLGNLLQLDNMQFNSTEEIKADIARQLITTPPDIPAPALPADLSFAQIKNEPLSPAVPLYRSDALVRYAPSLQRAMESADA